MSQLAQVSHSPQSTPGMLVAMLGLVLPMLIAAVAAIWFIRRRKSAISIAGAQGICGKCGYAVTGLTTFTCPECGSDLREVGIVKDRPRSKITPGGATPSLQRSAVATFFRTTGWKMALFVILFVPAAVYAVDYYVDQIQPTVWVDQHTIGLRPASGGYKRVTVTLTQRTFYRGARRSRDPKTLQQVATVDLEVFPNIARFQQDLLTGTNTYLDARGVRRSDTEMLSTALRNWFAAQGVDAAQQTVGPEIDIIANGIAHADEQGEFWDLLANESGRYFSRESVLTNSAIEGNAERYLMPVTIAVIAGLAGCAVLWAWQRKRSASPRVHGDAPQDGKGFRGSRVAQPRATPVVRTLSVMFSDVKDFTVRTANESRLGIIDLVRRHHDIAEPIIKRRGGRIVKSMGDGLLICFKSATDAVLAGLEIQATVAANNRSAFGDRDKFELRVAVSTGEIALDGGDIFGEAVNLASRAQQHAAPGEVLFTEATFATINRREIGFADAGTFDFKGVAGPARLYRAIPLVNPDAVRIPSP